ncbi:MAG: hypothetical protein ACRDGR_01290 [bacterium]
MWRTTPGSTGRLLQLCVGYFFFYLLTGVAVKYFRGPTDRGLPGMSEIEYLVYSTFGSASVVLGVVVALRWWKLRSLNPKTLGPWTVPGELAYLVPSGVCTAIVIPTTLLMYTLPISVMVAMVIMRGSIIVISRIVDSIQIRQGLLDRKVYAEENIAVGFAIAAVGGHVLMSPEGGFEFLRSAAAMSILATYIVAYSIRIYIMNYYKNTHGRGRPQDNRPFFGIEQLAASATLTVASLALFHGTGGGELIESYREAIRTPHAMWKEATISGLPFGAAAFFSVFLFLFQGRTATFAGLVNRLTSLIAGTAATLVFHWGFGGSFPALWDWISLGLILVAIGFLTASERRRVAELRARS